MDRLWAVGIFSLGLPGLRACWNYNSWETLSWFLTCPGSTSWETMRRFFLVCVAVGRSLIFHIPLLGYGAYEQGVTYEITSSVPAATYLLHLFEGTPSRDPYFAPTWSYTNVATTLFVTIW